MKTMTASAFEAECLRVIRELGRNREPVTITRRGHPVAVLSPLPAVGKPASIVGAMQGSVLYYDAPFQPAGTPVDGEPEERT